MAAIAESADLLTVKNQSWLLVPAPAWLLDTLAVFGTEAEDRENDLEDEPTDGAEPGTRYAIYPYFPTSMASPNILGGAIDGVGLPNRTFAPAQRDAARRGRAPP